MADPVSGGAPQAQPPATPLPRVGSLAGLFTALWIRFTHCFSKPEKIAQAILTKIQQQELPASSLRWFSTKQLQALSSAIQKTPQNTLATVTHFGEKAKQIPAAKTKIALIQNLFQNSVASGDATGSTSSTADELIPQPPPLPEVSAASEQPPPPPPPGPPPPPAPSPPPTRVRIRPQIHTPPTDSTAESRKEPPPIGNMAQEAAKVAAARAKRTASSPREDLTPRTGTTAGTVPPPIPSLQRLRKPLFQSPTERLQDKRISNATGFKNIPINNKMWLLQFNETLSKLFPVEERAKPILGNIQQLAASLLGWISNKPEEAEKAFQNCPLNLQLFTLEQILRDEKATPEYRSAFQEYFVKNMQAAASSSKKDYDEMIQYLTFYKDSGDFPVTPLYTEILNKILPPPSDA